MIFRLKQKLPDVLPAPDPILGNKGKWLSGEGAGSWFVFELTHTSDLINVKRFCPKGKLECAGLFVSNEDFDPLYPFTISYPSHCAVVTVIQNNKRIELIRQKSDEN